MKRILTWLGVLSLIATFGLVQWQQLLQAAAQPAAPPSPDVAIVVDSSASMQPELAALAPAWQQSHIRQGDQAANHLIQFKDSALYQGSTANPVEFYNWLNDLTAGGGGTCPDAHLDALTLLARGVPDATALLLSDAAPQGNRSQLAFIMDKLVAQRTRVFPLVTGWCQAAKLSELSMINLARLTGGLVTFADETETMTATIMVLDHMALPDTIFTQFDSGSGLTIYDIPLDSGVETVDMQAKCCICLTCTRHIDTPHNALTLQLRDSAGNVVQPGDPGVTYRETANGASFLIDFTQMQFPPPLTATWQLGVNSQYWHMVSIAADSNLHLSYLGQSVLPANKPSQIRASFIVSPGLPGLAAPASDVATLRFGMQSINGGPIAEIMLFDDGSHGDGQAGDGIYGGVITPPAGTWRLVASGTLADGSLFRRVDPIPIRVQRIRFGPAQNLNALAGSTVVQSFALTNEGAAPQSLDLLLSSSMGWAMTTTVPSSVTLGAGETAVFHVPVTIPPGAAAGDLEETALTVVDAQDIFLNQTATGITTVVTELTIFLPAIRR